MPEDEETLSAPGVLGDGIPQDGVDPGAARRAAIREANARRQQDEAARAVQRGQERAEKARRQAAPTEAGRAPQGQPYAHAGPCASRRPGPAAGGPELSGSGLG